MLPDRIHLEIVSPTRLLFSGDVDYVTLPGKEGYLGILPGHAPLISQLRIGEISYRKDQETGRFFCDWGVAEVLAEYVSVLAHIAERPEDIDVQRAREAKDRAEKRLRSKSPDTDFVRAELALRRAVTRIQVASGLRR